MTAEHCQSQRRQVSKAVRVPAAGGRRPADAVARAAQRGSARSRPTLPTPLQLRHSPAPPPCFSRAVPPRSQSSASPSSLHYAHCAPRDRDLQEDNQLQSTRYLHNSLLVQASQSAASTWGHEASTLPHSASGTPPASAPSTGDNLSSGPPTLKLSLTKEKAGHGLLMRGLNSRKRLTLKYKLRQFHD